MFMKKENKNLPSKKSKNKNSRKGHSVSNTLHCTKYESQLRSKDEERRDNSVLTIRLNCIFSPLVFIFVRIRSLVFNYAN